MSRLFSRSLIASSICQFHPPKLRFLASVCPEVDDVPIVSHSRIGSQIDRMRLTRPLPAELQDGSQPSPSMPAASHLGETCLNTSHGFTLAVSGCSFDLRSAWEGEIKLLVFSSVMVLCLSFYCLVKTDHNLLGV
ncbi:hypothetical protein F2Q68_00025627 [Brassica cretica]|uniref:Uncharacterized protein n=1 Tax=Brassica cretica TaxID=69181 RepID=A0A8S9IHA7_BRACR|nr:hypothetical protein F2Q68_00025627 [Brassica cretica]